MRIHSSIWPISMCEYHTSRVPCSAALLMPSRYSLAAARTTLRRSARENPLSRPAISKLAARRFTSHSQGPGSVSSKSLMSKIRRRSGEPNTPKLDRWASPQHCTVMPESGVAARSSAMISAAPRKKANGETSMRPYRMGTSSGTLVAACSSRRSIGSGRPAAGRQFPWDERGACRRADLPRFTRSWRLGRWVFRTDLGGGPWSRQQVTAVHQAHTTGPSAGRSGPDGVAGPGRTRSPVGHRWVTGGSPVGRRSTGRIPGPAVADRLPPTLPGTIRSACSRPHRRAAFRDPNPAGQRPG